MSYAFNPLTGNFDYYKTLSIGDNIGSGNANRMLYTDDSGNLADTLWETDAASYFGGLVTGSYLVDRTFSNAVRLEDLNLSGVGQPNAMAFTVNATDGGFYFVDRSTLTSYMQFKFDYDTRASSNFTVAFANGVSASDPEFKVTTTAVDIYVPLNMRSEQITNLAAGSANGHAVRYEQVVLNTLADAKGDLIVGSASDTITRLAVGTDGYYLKANSGTGTGLEWVAITADGILPTQTGNNGKFLTTNGTTASWGAVSASPGGSDTQVQFNDASAFGGDAGMTYNKTTDVLSLTSGVRIGSGSSNYLGDSGGNGSIYFGRNGNDADLYGYSDIRFYTSASANPFIQFSPSRLDYNPSNSLDFSPISAGQGDNSVGLMPNNIATYLGVGAGVYISGGVTATANNDFMVGTYFRARFTPGAFTGLTRTGVIFDVPDSNAEIVRFITRASNDDIVEVVKQSKITTTDATVTTLATITIPATTTMQIEATVVARRTGGTGGTAEDGAGYRINATVKNVAGTATIIGAVGALYTAEDQAGWDATIDVTGATARIRVTGATNNNVSWVTTYRLQPIGT